MQPMDIQVHKQQAAPHDSGSILNRPTPQASWVRRRPSTRKLHQRRSLGLPHLQSLTEAPARGTGLLALVCNLGLRIPAHGTGLQTRSPPR